MSTAKNKPAASRFFVVVDGMASIVSGASQADAVAFQQRAEYSAGKLARVIQCESFAALKRVIGR